MKTTAKAFAVGAPALGGYLTFLLSGVVMWFFMMYWFLTWWGLLGLIAALLLPPLTTLFPFIYWVQESFPITYFLIWLIGVASLFIGLWTTRLALKRLVRGPARQRSNSSKRSRSDIIEGEIVE